MNIVPDNEEMHKQETIHKAKGLEREFVILRNKDVQRKDLSYDAIGMLTHLLSLPDDWTIYVKSLQREKYGRDKVRKIITELETKGYISVEQGHDEQGRFTGNHYEVYAIPEYNPNFTPLPENPLTAKPSTVNPHLQSKESLKRKQATNSQLASHNDNIDTDIQENGSSSIEDSGAGGADDQHLSQVIALLESVTIVTPYYLDLLKEDVALYTYQEWSLAVDALKHRMREQRIKKPYQYLLGILKAQAREKALEPPPFVGTYKPIPDISDEERAAAIEVVRQARANIKGETS